MGRKDNDGSNIRRYMLRIWDEELSLAICGVDGKTPLTCYTLGRREYDNENPSPNLEGEVDIYLSPNLEREVEIYPIPNLEGEVWRLIRRPHILNQQG